MIDTRDALRNSMVLKCNYNQSFRDQILFKSWKKNFFVVADNTNKFALAFFSCKEDIVIMYTNLL